MPTPLGLVPEEADLAIAIDGATVRDTWLASTLAALAPRIGAPPCVIERARGARTIAIAWSEQLPDDGWMIALAGDERPPCPALVRRGPLSTWHRDLPPRAADAPAFFADRDRRVRLARRRDAPVRVVGDFEPSPGIVAAFELGLDPRRGLDAAATIRFASPAAADGARLRIQRWQAEQNPRRIGGAIDAIDAIVVRGPATGASVIELTARLDGPRGADAGEHLIAAFATGAALEPRPPCPPPTAMALFAIACDGEFTLTATSRAALAAAPADSATTGGRGGASIAELAPGSALVALGLMRGDTIELLDGTPPSPDWPSALVRRLGEATPGTIVSLRLRRGGRVFTLRYHIGD